MFRWLIERVEASRRFREALDRIETLERQYRRLDADFTDLLDRVNRQVARLVKRAERDSKAETTEHVEDPNQLHIPTFWRGLRSGNLR